MPSLATTVLPLAAPQTQVQIVLVVFLVLLLVLVIRIISVERRRTRLRAASGHEAKAAVTSSPAVTAAAGTPPPPPTTMPATFSEAELTAELKRRLMGLPADGSSSAVTGSVDQVVWVEDGDEVLVHLESLSVRLLDRIVLVSVDLEADQADRQTIVVPLALAAGAGPGGLLAVTEETPRGDPVLVARWGRTLQEAVWGSLLALASDHAATRGHTPAAISATPGSLLVHPAAPAPAPAPALEPASVQAR